MLVGLVVLLAILYVPAELGARALIRAHLAAAARARAPSATGLTTEVGLPVLPNLLLRRDVSSVRIAAGQVNLGRMTAERVTATATGVHLDVLRSLSQGKAVVSSIDHVDVAASFTPEEASRLLPSGDTFVFSDGTVSLKVHGVPVPGTARVAANGQLNVDILGIKLTLTPSGYPFAGCADTARVTPSEVTFSCSLERPGPDLFPHG